MQKQNSINKYFKTCKRSAPTAIDGFSTKSARKLFTRDDTSHDKKLKNPNNKITTIPASGSTSSLSDNEKSNNELCTPKTPPHETEIIPNKLSTPTRSPVSQSKLKEDLNLGEFKKVIRNSKRFVSLKESLKKFEACKASLKEIEQTLNNFSSPELKKFDEVQIEVPSSPAKLGFLKPRRLFWTESARQQKKESPYDSPRKLIDEGPSKSPVKPSFERHNHLLAEGKGILILPHKYLVLKEIFRSIDTIMKLMIDRGETVVFRKLRTDVQKMISRNFTERHLVQIKTVYPAAFVLSKELIKIPFLQEEKYELVIKESAQYNKSKFTESNFIVKRQKIFHDLLLERSKIHHEQFLLRLNPPIYVDKSQIKCWHPEFDLDKVPDIEPVPILEPPVENDKFISAEEFLEKTRIIISGNNRMERAWSVSCDGKSKETPERTISSTNQSIPSNNVNPDFQKAFQDIPKPVLEKVRANQAAKIVQIMTQTPAEMKDSMMLSRLPELARIMRIVFVDEKKKVLPEETVLLKVGHSYKEKMSNNDLIQHFQLISKHVPGWMNFFTHRNTSHIRLSKDADISRVLGKLQTLAHLV